MPAKTIVDPFATDANAEVLEVLDKGKGGGGGKGASTNQIHLGKVQKVKGDVKGADRRQLSISGPDASLFSGGGFTFENKVRRTVDKMAAKKAGIAPGEYITLRIIPRERGELVGDLKAFSLVRAKEVGSKHTTLSVTNSLCQTLAQYAPASGYIPFRRTGDNIVLMLKVPAA